MQQRQIAVGAIIIIVLLVVLGSWHMDRSPGECNVAYITLRGSLVTYIPAVATSSDATASEDVTSAIRLADSDARIDAIILAVDSPGGSPVAGEEIANALRRAHKPSVALIRDMGDSAAYLAASGAKTIFASAFSDVGDIGITSSYVDQAQYDSQQGITFNQLSVGAYKDLFDPDKPLTPAERSLVMSQLQIYYADLVGEIASNRNLGMDTVRALSDGRSFTGSEALDNDLIDHIGNIDDVRAYLAKSLGREPTICGIDN